MANARCSELVLSVRWWILDRAQLKSGKTSVIVQCPLVGPGRTDEDTRDAFAHGGWADGYQDDVSMKYAGEGMSVGDSLLFGHRTYDDVLGYWTSMGPNPFVDVLVGSEKFVVSHNPDVKLSYPSSELLVGDAVSTVAALKNRNPATS